MGVPEPIVERSARARAAASGQSYEEILAAWAGGQAVAAAPAEAPPTEEAPAEAPAEDAPATEEAAPAPAAAAPAAPAEPAPAAAAAVAPPPAPETVDRKSTRLNSSHSQISYAVFCLKKKNLILLLN